MPGDNSTRRHLTEMEALTPKIPFRIRPYPSKVLLMVRLLRTFW